MWDFILIKFYCSLFCLPFIFYFFTPYTFFLFKSHFDGFYGTLNLPVMFNVIQ